MPTKHPGGAGWRVRAARALLVAGALAVAAPPVSAGARRSAGGGTDSAVTIEAFRSFLLRHLEDSAVARATVGVRIVFTDDGLTIAEHNAGRLFHPASNMKLVSSAAALALLPPDSHFRTRLYAADRASGGTLRGDLTVFSGGDPLLDAADIDSLAGIVAAAGIGRISGDLVADLSAFDTIRWGRGWMWDDEPDPTAPFIAPLAVEGGAVRVVTAPGRRPGDPLEVAVLPSPARLELMNTSRTLPRGSGDSVLVTRQRGRDRILVGGALGLSSPPETTSVSVRDPAMYALHLLRERLAARGITVEGGLRLRDGGPDDTIRAAPAAGPPTYLGEIRRPLDPVLERVNAASDNFAAECLLRLIGWSAAGRPGTDAAGLTAMLGYLQGAGVDTGEVIAADGSGVSWYNALSPSDIVAVLVDMERRKSTFDRFHASLARPGRDGTLSERMRGGILEGRVAAKTGTLTGVSTLSGYLTTLSHRRVAFSLLLNHHPGRLRILREWQERLLEALVRVDPGG